MFLTLVKRSALLLGLSTLPLVGCNCDREVITDLPDAWVPPEQPVDAGPPPPAWPLVPGDQLKYSVLNVTYCNETLNPSEMCTEHDFVWSATYTIKDPGAALNSSTNAWEIPVEYFWQQAEKKGGDDAATYQTLGKLWFTGFAPWQETITADTVTRTYKTTSVMLKDGAQDTFPFFDVTGRFAQGAQAFGDYVRSLDPAARVETQEAARKFEAGYIEPGSNGDKLHYVQIIYHRLGFMCQVLEAIGPYDATKPKNNQGFLNNQRDYQSSVNSQPQLTRISGPKANMRQFCKCGTQAGSDCE